MCKEKYYIAIYDDEKRLLIHCLNKLRTRLIEACKATDPVDEVLMKIIKAKKKKFKIITMEV